MVGKAKAQEDGATPRYVCRWSLGFVYGGNQNAKRLDWGQVFDLEGLPGDEKLIRLGYIIPFEGGETYICGTCGDEFAMSGSRRQSSEPSP
jgi:hypothetical protein